MTGAKHYLGPFEAYARTRPETPFREDQPRLPVENFSYAREDILFDAAARHGFWTVHRPQTIVGYTVGNLMNIGVTLATTCRRAGASASCTIRTASRRSSISSINCGRNA